MAQLPKIIHDWQEVTSDLPPLGMLVEVKNDNMSFPVVATRGYVKNDGTISSNLSLFSLVMETEKNRLVSLPKGTMIHPTHWRYYDEK